MLHSLFLDDVFGSKDLECIEADFDVYSVLVPMAQLIQILVLSCFEFFFAVYFKVLFSILSTGTFSKKL